MATKAPDFEYSYETPDPLRMPNQARVQYIVPIGSPQHVLLHRHVGPGDPVRAPMGHVAFVLRQYEVPKMARRFLAPYRVPFGRRYWRHPGSFEEIWFQPHGPHAWKVGGQYTIYTPHAEYTMIIEPFEVHREAAETAPDETSILECLEWQIEDRREEWSEDYDEEEEEEEEE